MYNVFDDFMLFVCRFRDLSEPGEGKKNFGSLKRLGKIDAIPEFVASGSRLRVSH